MNGRVVFGITILGLLLGSTLILSLDVTATDGTLNVPGGSTRTISLGNLREGSTVSYSWSTNDDTQDLTFSIESASGNSYKRTTGMATGSDSFTVPSDDTYSLSWTYNSGWGSLATSTVSYDYSVQDPSVLSQIGSNSSVVGLMLVVIIIVVVIVIIAVAAKMRSKKSSITVGQQTAQYNYPQTQQPPQYSPPPMPPQAPPIPPQQPPYQPPPQQYIPPPVPSQPMPQQQPMSQPYQQMAIQPPQSQYPPQPELPQYPPQPPPPYPQPQPLPYPPQQPPTQPHQPPPQQYPPQPPQQPPIQP